MHDRLGRRGSRWTAVAGWALVLLVGAVLPSPLRRRPAFGRFGPDKLLHLVGHAVFAAVLADALGADGRDELDAAVLSVGGSTAFALLTGHLQRWVPGRVGERADLVAGLLGSILGALGWRYERRVRPAARAGFR